jgi:HNH endonuclease
MPSFASNRAVPELERACQSCGRHFVVPATWRGPPRRTCSRSCASRGPRRRVPLEERFWRHVTRTEACWLWTGLHRKSGAGILPVRQAGKVQRLEAARVAWELFVGPLPAGRRVWRRCGRPACVRPDHLVLGRRGQSRQCIRSEPEVALDVHHTARPDSRRTWWTRERVLAGLVAFNRATGQAPTTSRSWAGLIQRIGHRQSRYATAYGVLRHFPNFRAAWTAAGIQFADSRWAPWTAEQDRYILTQLGVQPTIAIAEALGRGEAAVRARARKLGLRVGTARGWPPPAGRAGRGCLRARPARLHQARRSAGVQGGQARVCRPCRSAGGPRDRLATASRRARVGPRRIPSTPANARGAR